MKEFKFEDLTYGQHVVELRDGRRMMYLPNGFVGLEENKDSYGNFRIHESNFMNGFKYNTSFESEKDIIKVFNINKQYGEVQSFSEFLTEASDVVWEENQTKTITIDGKSIEISKESFEELKIQLLD